MTSERIFNCLSAYLSPLVVAAGGIFAPSETVAETLALLGQSPGSWRCILQWQREDPTGERGEMEMKVLLVIQQARGMPVLSGSDITVTQANSKALLARLNQACAWMRAVTFDNVDISREPLQQGKTQWLNDPSFPTRQISAEFAIRYGLEPVTLVHITVPAV